MRPSRLACAWIAVLAAGCHPGRVGGGGVATEPDDPVQDDAPDWIDEGALTPAATSTALAFVDLGGAELDLVALAPEILSVELFARQAAGGTSTWTSLGTAFAGDTKGTGVAAGEVAGRAFVAVTTEDGRVFVLPRSDDAPHKLDFPVRAYATPTRDVRALAVADVDADGDDDLVIAERDHLRIVDVVAVMDARPEAPPGIGKRLTTVATGSTPIAVAVADADEDGALDLVAIHEGALDRALVHAGVHFGDAEPPPPVEVSLPGPARAVHASSCAGTAAWIELEDGRVVALGAGASLVSLETDLPAASRVSTTAGAVFVVGADGEARAFDACGIAIPARDEVFLPSRAIAVAARPGALVVASLAPSLASIDIMSLAD
jgi:hypothetical protein